MCRWNVLEFHSSCWNHTHECGHDFLFYQKKKKIYGTVKSGFDKQVFILYISADFVSIILTLTRDWFEQIQDFKDRWQ
jgi:hypothetical protein